LSSMRACKRSAIALLLALSFLLPVGGPARGAESPPVPSLPFERVSPEAKLVQLSLEECFSLALINNLDIEVGQYIPDINAAGVDVQKGIFDPVAFFNATYMKDIFPLISSQSVSTGGLSSVELDEWILSGGITGVIPSGMTYNASLTSTHIPFSTITDALGTNGEQEFNASLTFTQPLLKNFGVDVNTTGIRVAAKNTEASFYQLQQTVIQTLFSVEQAYWALVGAYENVRVQKDALKLSQDLLDQNRIRLRVGVIASLDVLQAEVGVAAGEEQVILALYRVLNARDQLIQVINLFPGRVNWDNVEIMPSDSPSQRPPTEYIEGDQIMTGLRNRPELKQLLIQEEAAELNAHFTKNQLLPTLNLNATVGLIGLDSDFNSAVLFGVPTSPHTGIDPAWDDLVSGDNFQWMVGLTFQIPWGNEVARGQYEAANLQVGQIDTSAQNLRLAIVQDVRSALRMIDTSWKIVVASKETTRFRRESLKANQKKYEVGLITAHDLLLFQNELAAAEVVEVVAITSYNISLSNLRRATGTLLQFLNVQVAAGS